MKNMIRNTGQQGPQCLARDNIVIIDDRAGQGFVPERKIWYMNS
jgi:hypothetical protein